MEDLRDLEQLARAVLSGDLRVGDPDLLERLRTEVADDPHLVQAWSRVARCPVETEADRYRFFHAARAFVAACRVARPDLASVHIRKSFPPASGKLTA